MLPELLQLLENLPLTDAEKLEPLRRRLPAGNGDPVGEPQVLTASHSSGHPGSLRGYVHREAPSFATFPAYAEAVAAHHSGGKEPPARTPVPEDEGGAWSTLTEMLQASLSGPPPRHTRASGRPA